MTEPKNAIIKQYQKLFELENVKLKFTDGALMAVAKESLEEKGRGAGFEGDTRKRYA